MFMRCVCYIRTQENYKYIPPFGAQTQQDPPTAIYKTRMRAAVFVLALLVVGSNAFLLDSLTETLGPHIETLKQAGSQLLSGLVAKGKQVLGELLSKASDAVSKLTTPAMGAIGRRSLGEKLQQWWTKAQAFNKEVMAKMDGQKHVSGSLFSGALNKLKELFNKLKANKSAFKSVDDFSNAVDDVVEDHADMQRRFLISFDDIKDAASSAFGVAKDIATSDAAKALAAQAAQAALAAALGKRSVLSDIGDFFAPHIDTLKDAVSGVGTTLKGHATNLWNAVKGSVTDLGTKLSGHADKLKEHGSTLLDHGKNALDALKGAVSDILSQTLANVAPAVSGIISTGTDAAGVVTGHVAGAVGGAAAASGSF